MENKPALEDILEILLITYNRCASLENTLNQLKDSPFTSCRFTVLDNCSTDDTPQVVAKYAKYFRNYIVIRHNRNIGGDYNYLRAVELSKSDYTWVLCDDDNYDFSNVEAAIEAILSRKYDLLYVASRDSDQLDWNDYGETSTRKLLEAGTKYYRGCTFWPALIYRTVLYDNDSFFHAPSIYPSFNFINKSVNDDFYMYVSQYQIVIRTHASTSEVAPLFMYNEWVKNAAKISDTRLRYKVIEDRTDKGFIKSLCFWIALDKANRTPGYWKRLVDIFFAVTPCQKMKFLLLLPVMIVPLPISLLVRAREIVYRLMGHKDVKNLPPILPENRN